MAHRNEQQGLRARFSNPLFALLIAAIAAVCAIAQCGLMLDAAIVAGAPDRAVIGARTSAAEPPRVAAAAQSVVVPLAESSRRN